MMKIRTPTIAYTSPEVTGAYADVDIFASESGIEAD